MCAGGCWLGLPQVGLGNSRSAFDEALLEAIRQASKSPAMKLVIIDARPKLNARANKTQGKGFENTGAGTAYVAARLFRVRPHNQ